MSSSGQRKFSERLKFAVVIPLADVFLRALMATYRVKAVGRSCFERRRDGEDSRAIYVSWHEMLLHGMGRIRHQNTCVVISTHRDGELIARLVARHGFALARGSSTRGGSKALRELLRAARDDDTDLAITVDGPKGPRRELKDGALVAAQMTGRPLVPVMAASDRAWRIRSWDRFMLSKPFARAVVCVGDELYVPRDAPRETLVDVYGPRLMAAMDATEQRCIEELRSEGRQPAPELD